MTYKLISWLNRWSRKWLLDHAGAREDEKQRRKDRSKAVNGLKVTEHSIIRYFERFEGYDIDEIRNKITGGSLKSQVDKHGTGKYTVGDMTVVVDGNYVITVYKDNTPKVNSIRGLEALMEKIS